MTNDLSSGILTADDHLGATAPLEYTAEFPLMGVPMHVRSNAREAIALAASDFGAWCALDQALIERERRIAMDVIVHRSASDGPAMREPVTHRRSGRLYVAAAGSTLLVADGDAGRVTCFVHPDILAWSDWYRWHVHGPARFAVSCAGRIPFHAASIVHNGVAILITGRSGAGKSTLAYAAWRLGCQVLAEEATHVTLDPSLRLWGLSNRLTLAPDAARLFPELRMQTPIVLPNGKLKLLCAPSDFQVRPPLTHDGKVAIVVLTPPVDAAPRVKRLQTDELRIRLARSIEPGFDQFSDAYPRLLAALSTCAACELSPGRRPEDSVEALLAFSGA